MRFVVMHVTMWSPFAKTINLSIDVSPPQDASSVYRCQVLKKKKKKMYVLIVLENCMWSYYFIMVEQSK